MQAKVITNFVLQRKRISVNGLPGDGVKITEAGCVRENVESGQGIFAAGELFGGDETDLCGLYP